MKLGWRWAMLAYPIVLRNSDCRIEPHRHQFKICCGDSQSDLREDARHEKLEGQRECPPGFEAPRITSRGRFQLPGRQQSVATNTSWPCLGHVQRPAVGQGVV